MSSFNTVIHHIIARRSSQDIRPSLRVFWSKSGRSIARPNLRNIRAPPQLNFPASLLASPSNKRTRIHMHCQICSKPGCNLFAITAALMFRTHFSFLDLDGRHLKPTLPRTMSTPNISSCGPQASLSLATALLPSSTATKRLKQCKACSMHPAL